MNHRALSAFIRRETNLLRGDDRQRGCSRVRRVGAGRHP
jgi:hypothetical protein